MIDQEKFEAILSRYAGEPADLIPILHELQETYKFLPKEELKEVARRLKVPQTQVFSVATFYKGFTLAPRGEHHIRVCNGTSCHLHGSERLAESLSRRLGAEPGQSTKDRQFSLEQVKCLGNCDMGPLMMVDDEYYGQVGIDRLTKILKPYRKAK
jgi:NADH:ubiquinone oxidoreductase subunit E